MVNKHDNFISVDLITLPLGGVSAITTSIWGKSLLFTMPRRGIVSSTTPGLEIVSDMVTCYSFAASAKLLTR